ncbi:bifunctional folylpolyglutamate synthase/dihydrofolate synthase [bacterium]
MPYNYLQNLNINKIKLGLERIKKVLDLLGNIQDKLNVIHIAGTNGKGTTAFFINNILIKSGFKTGLYTSPHLDSIYERIQINNINIPAERFEDYILFFQIFLERENIDLSYFEFLTLLALKYFYDEKLDFVIFECGLGGRLDATNVFTNPLVSILTNVSFDHMDYLGDSLLDILEEKICVFRKNVPVVTGIRDRELLNRIDEKAKKLGTPVYKIDESFEIFRKTDNKLNYRDEVGSIKDIELCMNGVHQQDNLSLAIKAIRILEKREDFCENIKEVAKTQYLKGRLELVKACDNKLNIDTLFDVAHNLAGIKTFAEYICNIRDRYEKIVVVFAMLKDKDYKSCIQEIMDIFDCFYITQTKANRSLPMRDVMQEFSRHGRLKKVKLYSCQSDVILEDIKSNFSDKDLVCMVGSFFLISEMRNLILG